jgi:D-serine deaminase-like pyridoxal phosphate-dependent protein
MTIGRSDVQLNDMPTPAVIIDLAIAKRNIAKLAEYGRQHSLGIRPHTKTHKSAMMARLQTEAGAVGLTVAKVGEADVMLPETDDLLVAYPALDPHRSARVAELAKRKTVRVGIDSAFAAEAIGGAAAAAGSTVGVLVDIDVGHHRTGVQSPGAALELAQIVSNTRGLRLDGIMCFPGQLKDPADQQAESLAPMEAILRETVELWKRAGLDAKIVSGGSSPTAYQSHHVKSLTEIRPGTYIYNDANMISGGFVGVEDCAVRIACTVVSEAVPGKVVIDAGSKTLTYDRRMIDPDNGGFGYVVEYPQAKVERLSEEHGEVSVANSERRPRLGERVHVIPNHVCPCINLHDQVYLKREDGTVEMMRVDARGKVV